MCGGGGAAEPETCCCTRRARAPARGGQARLLAATLCSPSSMSVNDQAVPLILPRPGMVEEGMYADSMPMVTPCVMAM